MAINTGVTTGLDDWKYQENYVERVMDNAAYTAAHPDDTLVMIGPPRQRMVTTNTLSAIGMMQSFQVTQQKPIVPVQTIGSGRSFFLSSKSSIQYIIGRLFVKGPNLIKALNKNAIELGIEIDSFDEPIRAKGNDNYLINLDSELLLIPFGMAVVFRDKSHNPLGGFYLELCVIQSWMVGLNAGQNMIMENVQGQCDRLLPLHHDVSTTHQKSDAIDAAIGFTRP